jgi:hypothetical protein
MKLNKSPGLDGLTVEFYRAFWGKLKPKCLRECSMKFHSKDNGKFTSFLWKCIFLYQKSKGATCTIENDKKKKQNDACW